MEILVPLPPKKTPDPHPEVPGERNNWIAGCQMACWRDFWRGKHGRDNPPDHAIMLFSQSVRQTIGRFLET